METIINKPSDTDETLADSGFYWRESNGIKLLVCGPLESAGFANGFSTRYGGVSDYPSLSLNLAGFDEDLAENIIENRRRFLKLLDGNYSLATAWQTHGDDVKVVKDRSEISETDTKYDALVSCLGNTLVGVKTADCVPILIGDTRTKSFAAVHAGWRGTVRSIVLKTVKTMEKEFGSDPEHLIAAIGPSACFENYEVGSDVIEAFGAAFPSAEKYFRPTRDGHALVDLKMANMDQLLQSGVRAGSIFAAPLCTMGNNDLFFSYRLEKRRLGKTGRLLSVIGQLGNIEAS